MPKVENLLYAAVGVGDFALEKVRRTRNIVDRNRNQKVYTDFVKRGRGLSKKITDSRPTKRAVEQTKVARSQVRAAATSVRKAVGANAQATREAARKTAKAS